MATVTLNFQSSPSRTLAVSVDNGDGSKVPVYGRDLRNVPVVNLSSGTANNAQGGANLSLHEVLTVPVGAPVTIDLTTFTDVAGRPTQSMARVKTIEFWLLGSDDTANGLTGNGCTGVSIGPAASNGFDMFLSGTTPAVVLGNGERVEWTTRKAAGLTVDATHKSITLTNNDGAIAAHVLITINGGSN